MNKKQFTIVLGKRGKRIDLEFESPSETERT